MDNRFASLINFRQWQFGFTSFIKLISHASNIGTLLTGGFLTMSRRQTGFEATELWELLNIATFEGLL